MARVKIEEIVDHLSSEFRCALEDTVKKVFPEAKFDRNQLFREFSRNVGRKCNIWETVPDQFVEKN